MLNCVRSVPASEQGYTSVAKKPPIRPYLAWEGLENDGDAIIRHEPVNGSCHLIISTRDRPMDLHPAPRCSPKSSFHTALKQESQLTF